MPTAVLLPSHGMPRALKWAPSKQQQQQPRDTTHVVHAGRVKKRSSSTMRPVARQVVVDGTIMDDAYDAYDDNDNANNDDNEGEGGVAKLESEIAFTYETLSTIVVMFDSLRHAYTGSKYEMDMSRCETRLSEKEKELLSAYDDISHQVIHLERQVRKLESKLQDLKSAPQQDFVSPSTTHEDLLSPLVFPIEQKQQQQLLFHHLYPSLLSNEPVTTPYVLYESQPTAPFVGAEPPLLPVAPPFPLYDIQTIMLMEMFYQDSSPWWLLQQQQF